MLAEVLLVVNRKEMKKKQKEYYSTLTYKMFYLILVMLFHLIFIYLAKTLKYNKALKSICLNSVLLADIFLLASLIRFI